MALAAAMEFDSGDVALFRSAVETLKAIRPRLLSSNFAVAVSALAHRDHSSRPWTISSAPGPLLTTHDFQRMCDDTWGKRVEFLPAGADGNVYKPFTDSFMSARRNNWRNSFDLQSGIGCDAPLTEQYLLSENYLVEERFDCVFRDSATAACLSPAGNHGAARTCFDPSKNGNPPGPSSRAIHRPKLLTRGVNDDGHLGYWILEPTPETLSGLLPDATVRVPLYPFAVALYAGSDYWLAEGRQQITSGRLARDLGLSEELLHAMFDPSPANPDNLRIVEFSNAIRSAPLARSSASPPRIEGPLVRDTSLAEPRHVTETSINVDNIRVAAGEATDPEERARLMERANRGHQRALRQLVTWLRASDYNCFEQSGGYDLYATHDVFGGHLFEVKTWTSFNLTKQIRGGWAQLWEYRYRNAGRWEVPPALYLVFDREPPADLWMWSWLGEFLGVVPCWLDAQGRLVTLDRFATLLPPHP
jgi:hypothetical protein